jgi:hypothetical protein
MANRMNAMKFSLTAWAILGVTAMFPSAAKAADPVSAPMKVYASPYYDIHTDLEPNLVREAYARMTAMAEEYHERTKGFAGKITAKLPFYLFSDKEDYLREGGPKGSAGVFTGGKLMAMATPDMRGYVWKVVQHEGFHQFAHKVMTENLPVWLDEGLAEYFAEGIWTGDGMVTGIINPGRLERVQQLIKDGNLLTFAAMMDMSRTVWNDAMASRNYDQAWSMVHFLVNGDGGKYCQAFSDFINDLTRGAAAKQAFTNRFGRDDKAFRARYEQWWAAQPPDGSLDLFAQAQTAILTSFLARAQYQKMKFDTADEFLNAVRDGNVQVDGEKHPRLWLPAALGATAARVASRLGTMTLEYAPVPRLTMKRPEGLIIRGTFTLSGDQRPVVKVTVEKPKAATSAPAPKATG